MKKSILTSFLFFLFIQSISSTRRPQSSGITKPITLKKGQAPVQEPGWKHCLTNMKARFNWITLKSPGYPKFAGTQLQCSWIIEAPIGYRVKIAFKDLNMAKPNGDSCRQQYVEIIDDTLRSSQGRFCGIKAPGDYVSQGDMLRIDLQGDKSRKVYKGFNLQYKFVKEIPGFRTAKSKQQVSCTGAPGRVNLNCLKSQQQKLLNTASNQIQKPKNTGPIRYASDRLNSATNQLLTTPPPDSGWVGGNPEDAENEPLATSTLKRRTTTASNRIAAKVQKSPKPKFESSGRVTAAPIRTNTNDGWENSNSANNNVPSNDVGIYYGQQNQPDLNQQSGQIESNTRQGLGSYVVVHRGGLSTTNLIIIVVAVLISILIVSGLVTFKYCYRRKRKPENIQPTEIKSETISNPNATLPGMPETISQKDMSYVNSRSFHSIPRTHNPTAPAYPNIYANNLVATLPPRCNPSFIRHDSLVHKRPLPPLPKQNSYKCELDEDYCSGSDNEDGVVTMRREFSKWEINSQKSKRINSR